MAQDFGLSLLADAVGAHYPVKRKGERRRLNPNLAGIKWLELERAADCVTVDTYGMTDNLGAAPVEQPFEVTRAFGWYAARQFGDNYPRPMFQLFSVVPVRGGRLAQRVGCVSCDNLAYSFSGCDGHDGEEPAESPPAVGVILSIIEQCNEAVRVHRMPEREESDVRIRYETEGGSETPTFPW